MAKVIAFVNNGFPLALHCGITVPGEPRALEVTEYQAECLRGDCRITTLSKEQFAARCEADKIEAKELEANRNAELAAEAEAKQDKADKLAEAKEKQAELERATAAEVKAAEKVKAKAKNVAKKKAAERAKKKADERAAKRADLK